MSLASLRSLRMTNLIICVTFSQLTYNAKCLNIQISWTSSKISFSPLTTRVGLKSGLNACRLRKHIPISVFLCKQGRLQATLDKMAGLEAKHMQTQLEGGLALFVRQVWNCSEQFQMSGGNCSAVPHVKETVVARFN